MHAARRLHFDLRLELEGALKSWAVPKGPSLHPGEKRLAVHTEDHPLEYLDFEDVIPKGQYGAGTMLVWDEGTWMPEDDPVAGYRKGHLRFRLEGQRLRGRWNLVRTGGRNGEHGGENWLLIKSRDEHAREEGPDPAQEHVTSVRSGRTVEEVKAGVDAPPAGSRSPTTPQPQLATLVARPPDGDAWLHEIKHDGYRLLGHIVGGRVRLFTRNGNDWTDRFPSLAAALRALPVDEAWIDGELCYVLADGRTSFGALQQALSDGDDQALVYFAFDLLFLDGDELGRSPLSERKRRLAGLLEGEASGRLRFSDHLQGNGPAVFAQACELNLEGIISKRAAAPYRGGRNRDWLKVKCLQRQEFVVVGYEPSERRAGFRSLAVAVHDGDQLVYAGRVGTGFDHGTLERLTARLTLLETDQPPIDIERVPRESLRGLRWVQPVLVAEVAYTDWTRDGVLRHPSFQGLREDKPAREVVRERPGDRDQEEAMATSSDRRAAEGRGREALRSAAGKRVEFAGLRLSNPSKVLFPTVGVTKRELAVYYEAIAPWMLPYVQHRPLTLLRCPEGQHRHCFWQKHAAGSTPDALQRVEIAEKEDRGVYLAVSDMRGLLALVQMGVLEIHVRGSRIDRLDAPDILVFDLDPAEDLAWDAVVLGAQRLRTRLQDLGLTSFVRTTGGKGLHLVVPVARRHGWERSKAFTQAVATEMVHAYPGEYTARLAKRARQGKIFIDYLRNAEGATAVVSFSTRARPGAPVAAPIGWDELAAGVRSDQYNVHSMVERLARLDGDPWDGFFDVRQSLTKRAMVAVGMET